MDAEVLWRGLLVVLGAWSVLPPYIGPALGMELDVSSDVEFVDHAIPGALVVICGTISVMLARGGAAGSLADVISLGVCCLAASGRWRRISRSGSTRAIPRGRGRRDPARDGRARDHDPRCLAPASRTRRGAGANRSRDAREVWFVGAGPRGARPLTVRAARAIAEADIVIWGANLVMEAAVAEHALRRGDPVAAGEDGGDPRRLRPRPGGGPRDCSPGRRGPRRLCGHERGDRTRPRARDPD